MTQPWQSFLGSLDFLLPKILKIILLSVLQILSVPDEVYSRNAPCVSVPVEVYSRNAPCVSVPDEVYSRNAPCALIQIQLKQSLHKKYNSVQVRSATICRCPFAIQIVHCSDIRTQITLKDEVNFTGVVYFVAWLKYDSELNIGRG